MLVMVRFLATNSTGREVLIQTGDAPRYAGKAWHLSSALSASWEH